MDVQLSYVYYDHELDDIMSRVDDMSRTCEELGGYLHQGLRPKIFTRPYGGRVQVVVEFVITNVKTAELNEVMTGLYDDSRAQLSSIEMKAREIVKAKDLAELGKL